MDIRDFLFQSSIIRAKADIHFGIQVGVSMQGYSTKMQWKMNIHEWISMFYGYQSSISHAFTDIYLDIH